jgi:alanyl-tRNA synthetase
VLPSNEGRGYVLRRIMRRAMRHARLLGADEPLMHKLLPALVQRDGPAYPELVRAEALISETLKLEETRFRKTLDRGLSLLDEATRDLGTRATAGRRDRLQALRHLWLPARPDPGRAARSGASPSTMPASRRPWSGRRRKRAPTGRAPATRRPRTVWFELRERVGATEFLGYDTEKAEGVVEALVRRRCGRRGGGGRRDRAARDEPDAVLRRIRRPDGRHRNDFGRWFPPES